MAKIDYSNLFSEARNNIKDLLSANLSDPVTSSSEFRKFIYSREPDVKSADFSGFPFIVINASELNIGKELSSLDSRSSKVSWTLQVDVIASDIGAGNNNGKGLTHVDTISNDIVRILNDQTNNNSLNANLMFHLTFSASGVDVENFHDELIYRRTFVISFETKIQTTV